MGVEESSFPLGLFLDFAFIAAILALRRTGGGVVLAVSRTGFSRDSRAAAEETLPSPSPDSGNVLTSFTKLDNLGLIERRSCSRRCGFVLVELGLTCLPTFDERTFRRS